MELLNNLGIQTEKVKLYEQALTHTSYANENDTKNYERLEYLGDAVLELIISEYLYKNIEHEEGTLTKLRSNYVCENALYEYSLKLGLNEYIRLGHGELESGGKFRKAIVADVFEAFMGALFLDQGFEKSRQFIYDNIIPFIEKKELVIVNDYKSLLQEWVQTDKRSLQYIVVLEDGPAHNKTFTVEARIDNIVYGKGIAHSKKEAEQSAAKDALQKAQNNIEGE